MTSIGLELRTLQIFKTSDALSFNETTKNQFADNQTRNTKSLLHGIPACLHFLKLI